MTLPTLLTIDATALFLILERLFPGGRSRTPTAGRQGARHQLRPAGDHVDDRQTVAAARKRRFHPAHESLGRRLGECPRLVRRGSVDDDAVLGNETYSGASTRPSRASVPS
jgi:hypothetical protein